MSDKVKKITTILRVHKNWLLYVLLGGSSISKKDLEEIQKTTKLPTQKTLNFVEKMYFFGRLKSLTKESSFKELDPQEFESEYKAYDFTPVDEMVVSNAKQKAGRNIKNLVDDIEEGVFEELQKTQDAVVTEAQIRDVVADETQLALIERKQYTKLSQDIKQSLKTKHTRNWNRLAATELVQAKNQGVVQAIVQKLDVYEHSEGIDSLVSVVPNPGTCVDCADKYLDSDGNPKIFKIRDLIDTGSNGDEGVSHKRSGGLHAGWKTTVPPLHPGCNCRIVYIPGGFGWVNGRMNLLQEDVFVSSIKKSSTGVRGTISATVKPKGPNSGDSAPKNPPSITGIPSPSNKPGPGRPGGSGLGVDWEYYSGSGTPDTSQGWEKSPSGKSWRRPLGSGSKKPGQEESEAVDPKKLIQDATAWSRSHTSKNSVVLGHIISGEVTSSQQLTGPESGINESWRVTIAGNGRGLVKTPFLVSSIPGAENNRMLGAGIGSVPSGTSHRREVGAYFLSNVLGFGSVPPTATRVMDGKSTSIQSWKEDSTPMGEFIRDSAGDEDPSNYTKTLLDKVPKEHKEKIRKKLNDMIIMDLIMNNNDRHSGNLLISNDLSDVHAIDHGNAFGNGMSGVKNSVFRDMHAANMKVTVDEDMMKRLKGTSLGHLKLAVGGHVEDWAVAQTFLRTRYVAHLQETEGELDFERFRTVMTNLDNTAYQPDDTMWANLPNEEFRHRQRNGQLPEQLFESWAQDYLDQVTSNPDHPDHADALEVQRIGPFMGPGAMRDPGKYRREGNHKNYKPEFAHNPNKKIRRTVDSPKKVNTLGEDRTMPNIGEDNTAPVPTSDAKTVPRRGVR